jgi:hypothetical protein
VKLREPRKTKKWHRKHGWSPRYTSRGELFYVRDHGPFGPFPFCRVIPEDGPWISSPSVLERLTYSVRSGGTLATLTDGVRPC